MLSTFCIIFFFLCFWWVTKALNPFWSHQSKSSLTSDFISVPTYKMREKEKRRQRWFFHAVIHPLDLRSLVHLLLASCRLFCFLTQSHLLSRKGAANRLRREPVWPLIGRLTSGDISVCNWFPVIVQCRCCIRALSSLSVAVVAAVAAGECIETLGTLPLGWAKVVLAWLQGLFSHVLSSPSELVAGGYWNLNELS